MPLAVHNRIAEIERQARELDKCDKSISGSRLIDILCPRPAISTSEIKTQLDKIEKRLDSLEREATPSIIHVPTVTEIKQFTKG